MFTQIVCEQKIVYYRLLKIYGRQRNCFVKLQKFVWWVKASFDLSCQVSDDGWLKRSAKCILIYDQKSRSGIFNMGCDAGYVTSTILMWIIWGVRKEKKKRVLQKMPLIFETWVKKLDFWKCRNEFCFSFSFLFDFNTCLSTFWSRQSITMSNNCYQGSTLLLFLLPAIFWVYLYVNNVRVLCIMFFFWIPDRSVLKKNKIHQKITMRISINTDKLYTNKYNSHHEDWSSFVCIIIIF